jgi:hypothetical protein
MRSSPKNLRKRQFTFIFGFRERPMGIFQKWWDINTDILHGITGVPTAAEKRDRAALVAGQMDAYKQQTEIAQKATDAAREQQTAEKRRMNEKQVASMRRHFSPAGFLDSSQPSDLKTTLGA